MRKSFLRTFWFHATRAGRCAKSAVSRLRKKRSVAAPHISALTGRCDEKTGCEKRRVVVLWMRLVSQHTRSNGALRNGFEDLERPVPSGHLDHREDSPSDNRLRLPGCQPQARRQARTGSTEPV